MKYKSIQGLRGLSILLVFVSHCYAGGRSSGFLPSIVENQFGFLNNGKYGVDIFFMISGFVISKSLLTHSSAYDFMIDRILRIYPPFTILHLVFYVVGPFIGYKFFQSMDAIDWTYSFIANFFLLPGIFDIPIAQIVAWSLSYEMLFYIVCTLFYYPISHQIHYVKLIAALSSLITSVFFHPRALFFIPGILSFLLITKFDFKLKIPGIIGLASLPIFIIAWSFLAPEDNKTLYEISSTPYYAGLFFGGSISASVFFICVVSNVTYISHLLHINWLVRLGDVSYSFYLLHTFIMFPIKYFTIKLSLPIFGSMVAFLTYCIASFVLTWYLSNISREWLEIKASSYMKSKIS